MTIEIFLVGVGTGNPRHITLQAVKQLKSADILIIPRKDNNKSDLANLRHQICNELLGDECPPLFEFDLPPRNNEKNYSNLLPEYSKFLISITPVLPHFANECLSKLKINEYSWPEIDNNFLIEENVSIVVQFNGKKRGIILLKKDTEENEIIDLIKKDTKLFKYLDSKEIRKKIFVKNKIINLIV